MEDGITRFEVNTDDGKVRIFTHVEYVFDATRHVDATDGELAVRIKRALTDDAAAISVTIAEMFTAHRDAHKDV